MFSFRKFWKSGSIYALSLLVLFAYSDFVCAKGMFELRPPTNTPARFDRAFFGMHIHKSLEPGHWPDVYFGSWRLWDAYATWSKLEPEPGYWDFRLLDDYVTQAEKSGIRLLLPLGVTPRWASRRPDEPSAYGPGQAAEPKNIEDWRRYVRTVGNRYRGRIFEYEIWNEVTERGFWTGDIKSLVQLTCVARDELKSIDPEIKIVAPSSTGIDKRLQSVRKFLEAGGAECVDVLSYHLYHGANPPDAIVSTLALFMADLKSAGFGRFPIWNTESGYWFSEFHGRGEWGKNEIDYSIDETLASQYIPKIFLLERALGFERHYWYAWDNRKMGLFDFQGRLRMKVADVYHRFSTRMLRSELRGCSRSSEGLWICSLALANGRDAFAVWVDSSVRGELAITAAKSGDAQDFVSDISTKFQKGARITVSSVVQLLVFDF